jgi:signal peptidase I
LEELDSTTTASQVQDMAPVQEGADSVQGDVIPAQGEASADQATPGRGALHLLREIIETVLLTLVIFIVINALTGRFRIEGPSMKPTLHEGEYLIISKIVYKLHPPQRGDIIVFHHPQDPTRDLIKRIVGLPGEEVEIFDGQVHINGEALEEPYVTSWGGRPSRQKLGQGEYFVLGDNRPNSDDSRSWGGLERDNIVGKAWLAYWPPEDWGLVPHHSHAQGASDPGQAITSDD